MRTRHGSPDGFAESSLRWLKHAFAIDSDPTPELTDEQSALLDRLALELVRRRMALPALLFLESSLPLNFLASQFLVFIGPFAKIVFPPAAYQTLVSFLEKRGSLPIVCDRIRDAIDGRLVEPEDPDPQSGSGPRPGSGPGSGSNPDGPDRLLTNHPASGHPAMNHPLHASRSEGAS